MKLAPPVWAAPSLTTLSWLDIVSRGGTRQVAELRAVSASPVRVLFAELMSNADLVEHVERLSPIEFVNSNATGGSYSAWV